MVCIRVPAWGFSHGEAEYYGWRHGAHIGPFLIFWGRMADPAPGDVLRDELSGEDW